MSNTEPFRLFSVEMYYLRVGSAFGVGVLFVRNTCRNEFNARTTYYNFQSINEVISFLNTVQYHWMSLNILVCLNSITEKCMRISITKGRLILPDRSILAHIWDSVVFGPFECTGVDHFSEKAPNSRFHGRWRQRMLTLVHVCPPHKIAEIACNRIIPYQIHWSSHWCATKTHAH